MQDSSKKKQLEIKSGEKIEILFVGDTTFGENYQQDIQDRGGQNILNKGYDYPFDKMKDILLKANLVIANLESPITNIKNSPFFGKKKYLHWSNIVKAPKYLFKHNIKCVNLANNHIFDYGQEGLKQTLEVLKLEGIDYFGAGENITEASKPYIIEIKHENKIFNIAIIPAFEERTKYREEYEIYAKTTKSGVPMLNIKQISNSIQQIKKLYPSAIIILSPHWGKNYEWKSEKQENLAKSLVELGVDLIIGHGAHMLQEIECLDNHWVIYNIGNFIFNSPGRYNENTPPYGLVTKLICTIKNNILHIHIRLYPIATNNKKTNYQNSPVTDQEFHDLNQVMEKKSSFFFLSSKTGKDEVGNFYELPFKPPKSHSTKSHASLPSKNVIGMLCNVRMESDLTNKYTPWICRSWVMDKAFKKENISLFMYSPRYVDPKTGKAKGYFIENNKFVFNERNVPSLNYDWCMLHHKPGDPGLSCNDFFAWARDNRIVVYPNNNLARLAKDKYKSYELIKKHNASIQPESENLDHDPHKLNIFFDKSNLIFLKPRFGNHGEGMIVIEKGLNKRGLNYYLLNHYMGKEKREIYYTSLKDLKNYLSKAINKHDYIIQTGIKSLRKEGSAFNIRVLMVHDGKKWQWTHEIRASTHYSAISTYPYLGMSYPLHKFLDSILPKSSVTQLIGNLQSLSFELIEYFDSIYPGEIGELAFDFVADEHCKVYLAEINTKPGIIGDPNTLQNFFEVEHFGEQTDLYTGYLAKYFKSKL